MTVSDIIVMSVAPSPAGCPESVFDTHRLSGGIGIAPMDARTVYEGSDGSVTTAYYRDLSKLGPVGQVALNLFRAQKCSYRAKKYRGGIKGVGSYLGMAYDRKEYSLKQLCDILSIYADSLQIKWGWKSDPNVVFGNKTSWVMYVDLPQGQVSFHNTKRLDGPKYEGDWDGERASCARILAFCDSISGLKGDIPTSQQALFGGACV